MAEPAKAIRQQPEGRKASAPAAEIDVSEIVCLIERASSNAAVDIDKFERLLALHERQDERERERAFNAAMSAAQAELAPVAADASNPQTNSRYASYAALDRAVRPAYSRQGLSVSFNTDPNGPADYLRVVARVRHASGHKEFYQVDLPADGKAAKIGEVPMTKTHAVGASMSYGQRYLLKLIFNIAVGDDTDGNSNGGRDVSAAFTKAVETVNGHKTAAEHRRWRSQHFPRIERTLSETEAKELVALWNRRARALRKTPAKQVDGGDHSPGVRR